MAEQKTFIAENFHAFRAISKHSGETDPDMASRSKLKVHVFSLDQYLKNGLAGKFESTFPEHKTRISCEEYLLFLKDSLEQKPDAAVHVVSTPGTIESGDAGKQDAKSINSGVMNSSDSEVHITTDDETKSEDPETVTEKEGENKEEEDLPAKADIPETEEIPDKKMEGEPLPDRIHLVKDRSASDTTSDARQSDSSAQEMSEEMCRGEMSKDDGDQGNQNKGGRSTMYDDPAAEDEEITTKAEDLNVLPDVEQEEGAASNLKEVESEPKAEDLYVLPDVEQEGAASDVKEVESEPKAEDLYVLPDVEQEEGPASVVKEVESEAKTEDLYVLPDVEQEEGAASDVKEVESEPKAEDLYVLPDVEQEEGAAGDVKEVESEPKAEDLYVLPDVEQEEGAASDVKKVESEPEAEDLYVLPDVEQEGAASDVKEVESKAKTENPQKIEQENEEEDPYDIPVAPKINPTNSAPETLSTKNMKHVEKKSDMKPKTTKQKNVKDQLPDVPDEAYTKPKDPDSTSVHSCSSQEKKIKKEVPTLKKNEAQKGDSEKKVAKNEPTNKRKISSKFRSNSTTKGPVNAKVDWSAIESFCWDLYFNQFYQQYKSVLSKKSMFVLWRLFNAYSMPWEDVKGVLLEINEFNYWMDRIRSLFGMPGLEPTLTEPTEDLLLVDFDKGLKKFLEFVQSTHLQPNEIDIGLSEVELEALQGVVRKGKLTAVKTGIFAGKATRMCVLKLDSFTLYQENDISKKAEKQMIPVNSICQAEYTRDKSNRGTRLMIKCTECQESTFLFEADSMSVRNQWVQDFTNAIELQKAGIKHYAFHLSQERRQRWFLQRDKVRLAREISEADKATERRKRDNAERQVQEERRRAEEMTTMLRSKEIEDEMARNEATRNAEDLERQLKEQEEKAEHLRLTREQLEKTILQQSLEREEEQKRIKDLEENLNSARIAEQELRAHEEAQLAHQAKVLKDELEAKSKLEALLKEKEEVLKGQSSRREQLEKELDLERQRVNNINSDRMEIADKLEKLQKDITESGKEVANIDNLISKTKEQLQFSDHPEVPRNTTHRGPGSLPPEKPAYRPAKR